MSTTRSIVLKLEKQLRSFRVSDQANGSAVPPTQPQHVSVAAKASDPAQPPLSNTDKNDLKLALQIVGEIHEKLASIEQSRSDAVQFIQEIAVELAMAVSSKVLCQTIDDDAFPFQETVKRMLNESGIDSGEGPIKASVNRVDFENLQAQLGIDDSQASNGDHIQWQACDNLQRGSVQLDANEYSIYFDTALHLQEIRQVLLETIHGSQVEHRKNEESDSTIRRFPDRRASG